jgi:hypothetical protein
MSSDCIERDLDALIDGFKIAIPEKSNPTNPANLSNLEVKKQESINRLEQVWAFIDH